jgi:ribosomal protein S18 acetylase RimI-like enzyme
MSVRRAVFPRFEDGGLVVDRIHGQLSAGSARKLATAFEEAGFQAWSGAPWVGALAAAGTTNSGRVAQSVFSTRAEDPHPDLRYEAIRRSTEPDSDTTYWAADWYRGSAPGAMPGNNAFLEMRREVRGSAWTRWLKRLTGIGHTAVIANLNVRPEAQRRGLATALVYSALQDFHDRDETVLRISNNDPVMQGWATAHGYGLTGAHNLPPDEPGIIRNVLEYTGQVGTVRAAMETARPWLQQSQVDKMPVPPASDFPMSAGYAHEPMSRIGRTPYHW